MCDSSVMFDTCKRKVAYFVARVAQFCHEKRNILTTSSLFQLLPIPIIRIGGSNPQPMLEVEEGLRGGCEVETHPPTPRDLKLHTVSISCRQYEYPPQKGILGTRNWVG